MHLDIDNLNFSKIFIELRYGEAFTLPTKKYEILEALKNKYTAYNADQAEVLSLLNTEKRFQIHIEINRMVIDWDAPISFKDFSNFTLPVVNTISKILQIGSYIRVGIRSLLTAQINSADEINQYIFQKYFSSNARDTSLIADEISNPAIKFSGRKGQVHFNMTVGYQQVLEAAANTGQIETLYHNLLVDIDSFRSNINKNRLQNLFTDTDTFLNDNVKRYLKGVES
ncbi:hypothetical protein PP175_21585 [Aneurinibacillus sp. Ricciae_BoGa-3]|uniref:hypothetical protein n=1 Tax=Aneurinibacillus sp. Ricciae_BoGa-3 TaxID=3022697 RepID=UPI002340F016|nr:hypothetical protein [Aneurinibacillus sp. Ricciae_BoGa-3]WCK53884.1 hypothetical protein PP175_21585 [Aneurinibacillus sp. Ricciae_BoGa-3]